MLHFPALQKHFKILEALALERDAPEDVVDLTGELSCCPRLLRIYEPHCHALNECCCTALLSLSSAVQGVPCSFAYSYFGKTSLALNACIAFAESASHLFRFIFSFEFTLAV